MKYMLSYMGVYSIYAMKILLVEAVGIIRIGGGVGSALLVGMGRGTLAVVVVLLKCDG